MPQEEPEAEKAAAKTLSPESPASSSSSARPQRQGPSPSRPPSLKALRRFVAAFKAAITKLDIYVAAAFGGVLLVIGDLLQNDKAATTWKLQEVLRQNVFQGLDYGVTLGLIFIVMTSCFLCWVEQPRSRADALARGAAVFAVLSALTPYRAPSTDLDQDEAAIEETKFVEPKAGNEVGSLLKDLFAVRAFAAEGPQEHEYGTLVLVFEIFDAGTLPASLSVVVRDPKTARVLGEETTAASSASMTRAAGQYEIEIEGKGIRRARLVAKIEGGTRRYLAVKLKPSTVPLTFQRFYPPEEVQPRLLFRPGPKRVSMSELADFAVAMGIVFPSGSPRKVLVNQLDLHSVGEAKVVVDHSTGLMWQQSGSSKQIILTGVEKYVEGLNEDAFAGFSDWRVPTVEELLSLLSYSEGLGIPLNTEVFDPQVLLCWSSDRGEKQGRRLKVNFDHRFSLATTRDPVSELRRLKRDPKDYLFFVEESSPESLAAALGYVKAVRHLRDAGRP